MFFFHTALDLCVHDFASKIDSNMVPKKVPFLRPPKKVPFLRPLTLLKCSKYLPDLTFPGPGEGPFSRSLFETPPEHAFYHFFTTLGSFWGPFWNPVGTKKAPQKTPQKKTPKKNLILNLS